MADYDNRVIRGRSATDIGVVDAGLRAYMLRVYNYMLIGLALTGATAWLTAETAFGQLFYRIDPVSGLVFGDHLDALAAEPRQKLPQNVPRLVRAALEHEPNPFHRERILLRLGPIEIARQ